MTTEPRWTTVRLPHELMRRVRAVANARDVRPGALAAQLLGDALRDLEVVAAGARKTSVRLAGEGKAVTAEWATPGVKLTGVVLACALASGALACGPTQARRVERALLLVPVAAVVVPLVIVDRFVSGPPMPDAQAAAVFGGAGMWPGIAPTTTTTRCERTLGSVGDGFECRTSRW